MESNPTRLSTQEHFRVVNGASIHNVRGVTLDGKVSNGNPVDVATQVADVTKPAAAASEIVGAGNLIIMHKHWGMVDHLSNESQDRILGLLKAEEGPEAPASRKGNTFLIEVDVKTDEVNGFSNPQKTTSGRVPMR